MSIGGQPQTPRRVYPAPLFRRAVWRYRAFVFGLVAFALAVVGEQWMRTPIGGAPVDPALGAALVQVAALLVGLVSWVRDDYFAPRRVVEAEAGSGQGGVGALPARARRARAGGGGA